MKTARMYLSAALLAVMFVVTGCSDNTPAAPATPEAAQQVAPFTDAELLGLLAPVLDPILEPVLDAPIVDPLLSPLLRPILNSLGLVASCEPMRADWASKYIGRDGGYIRVGPHVLVIPRNALSGWTRITAYMPSDNVNRVQFGPHGLQFRRSAVLSMSYENCDVGDSAPGHIAYVSDDLSILEMLDGVTTEQYERVSTPLDHFSSYALAW